MAGDVVASAPTAHTVAIYAGSLVVERGFALGLTALLAYFFGAGDLTDGFYIAYWLPVAVLTIGGEIAFVTLFPGIREVGVRDGANAAAEAARRSLRASFARIGAVAALYAVASPAVVILIAGDQLRNVGTTVFLGLAYTCYVVAALATSSLGAVHAALGGHRRNALALPVGTALIATSTAGLLLAGVGVFSYPVGAGVGQSLTAALFLWPALRQELRTADAGTASAVDAPSPDKRLTAALLLASLCPLLVIALERGLAIGTASGSVSALNYARTFLIVPGLIAAPLGTALMDRLPSLMLQDRSTQVWRSIDASLFTGLVGSIGLAVASTPLVRVLLGRGEFDERAVQMTSDALLLMLLGAAGFALYPLALRMLQSQRDTIGLLIVTATTTVYALVAPFLVSIGGADGLAVAYAVTFTTTGVFGTRRLVSRFGHWPAIGYFKLAAQACLALGITVTARWLSSDEGTQVEVLSAAAACASFIVLCRWSRLSETALTLRFPWQRLGVSVR